MKSLAALRQIRLKVSRAKRAAWSWCTERRVSDSTLGFRWRCCCCCLRLTSTTLPLLPSVAATMLTADWAVNIAARSRLNMLTMSIWHRRSSDSGHGRWARRPERACRAIDATSGKASILCKRKSRGPLKSTVMVFVVTIINYTARTPNILVTPSADMVSNNSVTGNIWFETLCSFINAAVTTNLSKYVITEGPLFSNMTGLRINPDHELVSI